jgi:hypothetical protein
MAAPGQTIVLLMVLRVHTIKDKVLQVHLPKGTWSAGIAGNKVTHRPTAENEQPGEMHQFKSQNPSMKSPSTR